MKKKVRKAIKLIEENDWVKVLRDCSSLKEKYDKLMELLPETRLWSPLPARQLVFYLHQKYHLDFGVCPFYKMKGDRQYCKADGKWVECLCVIPQSYCIFRDKNGKPKYPDFLSHFENSVVK